MNQTEFKLHSQLFFYNTINGDYVDYIFKHNDWKIIKNIIVIYADSISIEDKLFFSTLEDRNFAYINNFSTKFFSINFFNKIVNEFNELEKLDSPFNRDCVFSSVTEIALNLNQLDVNLPALDFLKKQYNIFSNIDKSNEFINVDIIKNIFSRYNFPNLKNIVLSGSNLLNKSAFYDIIRFLKPRCKIKLFISYKEYMKNVDEYTRLNLDIEFNLICDQYFSENIYIDYILFKDANVVFNYYINDLKGLNFLVRNESLINKLIFNVHPYYSNNKQFLSKIITYTKNAILTEKKSKMKIIRNYLVNEFFYGRIVIHNNGDIFSNLLLNPAGNLNSDSFSNILYKISRDSYSWLFPRNKFEKCGGCLYNCFCPPLTLIELVSNDTYCDFTNEN